ncbi:anti-sigma factor family protein [Desulfotignum balticum]|uniref:anti-sigma factor family protein n=1 Tax=Desulfotignum balticum TaxID=115781 RepID=UPI0004192214|nr:zf-HC2 domain-containing protein [Desulfotignum balticum]
MTNTCGKYTEKQISRYVDGDLSRHQIRRIRQHLDTCPDCRHLAAQFQEVTRTFNELTELPGVSIDPARVHEKLEQPAKKPVALRTDRFFRRPVRPFLVAAASLAALFVITVFALTNDGPAIAGPSAIVKSIDTDYTAVMIFETPDTHHTIIWYSET